MIPRNLIASSILLIGCCFCSPLLASEVEGRAPAGMTDRQDDIEVVENEVLSPFGIRVDKLPSGDPEPDFLYGNSIPAAWASIDSLGGITESFGVATVNNSATGVYEITLDNDVNPANTPVVITPFTIGFGIPEIAGYETTGANTFTIRIQNADGVARDSAFSFVVFGH